MSHALSEQIAAYIEQRCQEINDASRADERDYARHKLVAIVELNSKQICEALRNEQ